MRSEGRPHQNIFPITTPLSVATQQNFRAVPGGFGAPGFDKGMSYNFANNADFTLGDLTLTSITGYSSFKSETLGPGHISDPVGWGLGTTFNNAFSQVSQELRLLSPTGEGNAIDWIVGAYVDSSSYRMNNRVRYNVNLAPLGNFNGQTTINFRMNTFSYSAYANATWHITEDLRLLGSARFTRVGKNAAYVSTVDFGAALLFAGPRALAGQVKENHFDPSITAQYDLFDDRVKLYASWARGSKGGSFDSINRAVLAGAFQLRPEVSTNYEIGAKTQIYDWLQFNVAAYILKFKNLQVAAYDPALLTNVTRNAGAARSEGIEITFNARVTEGLTLSGSGAYMEAYYTDYPGAACTFPQNNPPTVPPCAAATNNIAGYGLPYAPKWSGQAKVNYVYPIDDVKLVFDGAANMTSATWLDGTYTPGQSRQFGNVKLDARLELSDRDDAWAVAVIGRNLNDVRTAAQTFTWPFATTGGPASPSAGMQLDEPRTVAIQGSLKF